MAIGVQNFPNVDTSDPTNYPGGQIQDAAVGVLPTPVNVLTNGDLQQFFYKLMAVAGLTPSNTPDNATNGYQYYQALLAAITPAVYYTTVGSVLFQSITGGQAFNVGGQEFYEFNIPSGSFGAINVLSFGSFALPGARAFFYVQPATSFFTITLNATTAGSNPIIVQNGVSTPDTAFTPIAGVTYMVIRRHSVWEIVG